MSNFLLYESSSGFALFEDIGSEEIGALTEGGQSSVTDLSRFSKMVKLKAFMPFTSAENALEAINEVSEGVLNDDLKNFLEQNLPKAKPGKKSKFTLGVSDSKLGSAIQETTGIACKANEKTMELIRGVRLHFGSFIKDLKETDLQKAQLGLAHSYSRSKVKFNVNRADNMIIQAICLLDQLDKDLNTFAMRVKEWYGWHFPELVKIVGDSYKYAQLVLAIQKKETVSDETAEELESITEDPEHARAIVEAARHSMGYEINDVDLSNVSAFATRVMKLSEYRKELSDYLSDRMNIIAPNLTTLVGEMVGARLISHAGSLTNLAKYPASTVQILGAEKALFRALKTKGNTPKYGLIFHSSFIGRASAKNKGRISRYLANKCSMAARIDCFSEETTNVFGTKLKDQVEERLSFYDTGEAPRKNLDVMREAIAAAGLEGGASKADKKKKKKKKGEEEETSKKKRKAADSDDESEAEASASAKKKKKKKKRSE